jgi:hypothetical protein
MGFFGSWFFLLLGIFSSPGASASEAVERGAILRSEVDLVGGTLVAGPESHFYGAHCTARGPEDGECLKARIVQCAHEMYCDLFTRTFGSSERLKEENRQAIRGGASVVAHTPTTYATNWDIAFLISGIGLESNGRVAASLLALPLCFAIDVVTYPFQALFMGPSYLHHRNLLIRNLTFMLDKNHKDQKHSLQRRRFNSLEKVFEQMDQFPQSS